MIGLKSYVKLILLELNKHDWSWENKNRYSDFFDVIAPILDVPVRNELNRRLGDFQIKWHGIRPITAEHLIHSMQFYNLGKHLIFKQRLRRPAQYDIIRKVNIDWMAMELDLRKIKNWCFNQLKRMVMEKDIDFSKEEGLNLMQEAITNA